MQDFIDSGILDRIYDLSKRKRDADLADQVKVLSSTAAKSKVMTPRIRTSLALILSKLRVVDLPMFEELASQVNRLCLSVVGHEQLRKALSRALNNFCRERRKKEDVDALLTCHLSLVENNVFEKSLDPELCLDYFMALTDPFTSEGDFADLEAFWQEATAFSTSVNGPRHKTTADALMLLAIWLKTQGDYAGACHMISRSIEILRDWNPSREDLLDVLLVLAETAVEGQSSLGGFFALTIFGDTIHEIRQIVEELGQKDSTYAIRLDWVLAQKDRKERALPDLTHDIENMIGLDEVKTALREHGVYMDFLRLRKERGLQADDKPVLHAVFTGNPGTGKTTVARLLGQIYHRLGLLSNGHVHTVVRADLVGTEYGSGEKRTRVALSQAKGGVLFIDEAYSLSRHYLHGEVDDRDPGQQVIETLLPALTDKDSDTAIILAGYPKEMDVFLASNPGLRSRFKLNIQFPDYTPPQMLDIASQAAARNQIRIEQRAQDLLLEQFEKAYHIRNKFFANARYVISIVDDCKRGLGMRIMAHPDPKSLSDDELSLITAADVRTALSARDSLTYRAPVNEKVLAQALSELNALIGLTSVKESVQELIKVVRLYRELGKDVLKAFKLHAVFAGNPGTGKTTVARILSQVYWALGILEKGHLVECDRSSLVADYLGVTESNTRAKIEEAMGGVLFIDEAYALAGSGSDFGPRVIEVLLKEMEDKRGRFFVILSGYKDEMNQLLDMNPGLRSRIDRTISFENFNVDELQQIALTMFAEQDLSLHPNALEILKRRLKSMAESKEFADGRSVRKYVDKVVVKHFASLADIPTEKRTPEVLSTIEAQLLEQVVPDESAAGRKLGF